MAIEQRQQGRLASITCADLFEIVLKNGSEVLGGRIVATIDQIAKGFCDWEHHPDE